MKKILFSITVLSAFVLTVFFTSCEKDARVKPSIEFIRDSGYIYKDTTLARNTTFNIGVNIKKTEDDLKTYSFEIGYDGASPSSSNRHSMTGSSEKNAYSHTEVRTTRNQAGKEVYRFTVTDADGNISSVALTVTVQ